MVRSGSEYQNACNQTDHENHKGCDDAIVALFECAELNIIRRGVCTKQWFLVRVHIHSFFNYNSSISEGFYSKNWNKKSVASRSERTFLIRRV